jgi:hypothetical protein
MNMGTDAILATLWRSLTVPLESDGSEGVRRHTEVRIPSASRSYSLRFVPILAHPKLEFSQTLPHERYDIGSAFGVEENGSVLVACRNERYLT